MNEKKRILKRVFGISNAFRSNTIILRIRLNANLRSDTSVRDYRKTEVSFCILPRGGGGIE